jgi:hypothetical protein
MQDASGSGSAHHGALYFTYINAQMEALIFGEIFNPN